MIYQGALLEVDANGNVSPLSATGNFAGVALEDADNTGGAAGDIRVQIVRKGILRGVTTAGTPAVGTQVYSATDNPMDATTVSTGATSLGACDTEESSGVWALAFEARGLRSV